MLSASGFFPTTQSASAIYWYRDFSEPNSALSARNNAYKLALTGCIWLTDGFLVLPAEFKELTDPQQLKIGIACIILEA